MPPCSFHFFVFANFQSFYIDLFYLFNLLMRSTSLPALGCFKRTTALNHTSLTIPSRLGLNRDILFTGNDYHALLASLSTLVSYVWSALLLLRVHCRQ